MLLRQRCDFGSDAKTPDAATKTDDETRSHSSKSREVLVLAFKARKTLRVGYMILSGGWVGDGEEEERKV